MAGFTGAPPMNLVDCTLDGAAARLGPLLLPLPTELAAYAAVTPAQVQAAMQRWLSRPVYSQIVEPGEREADRYSLETVNLPDALASALVKTAEYRYPRPHPLQEIVFYSHPSVENRVLRAMEWKAAHPSPAESAPAKP